MSKAIKRKCPQCGEIKEFRADQKTCGCKPAKELKETSEITDNNWVITLPKTRIHTLDQLIAFFEIDLGVWEVDRFIANKWEMGYKDVFETAKVEELYQVKAFLKRKHHIVFAKREIEELKEAAKKESKEPIPKQHEQPTSGNMLEINLIDHHFGKMAWSPETGYPNYDIHIAEQVFWRGFYAILERAKGLKFEEIYFVVGNDLFNSDDAQGRTTDGTHIESTDARFYKTFSIVRNVSIKAIEILREYANVVRVIMISGNHDKLSVWHLGDSLDCYFNKYADVKIDNSPRYYKYYEFGKVMLMYTHGDKGKKKDYPLMMATEHPDIFGRTRYREAHIGHTHTETSHESHGVVVRTLSPLCPPDKWHADNGYVGNIRRTQAFVYNKNEGLIGIIIYTDNDDLIEKAGGFKK
jgi:hypothetical protein